MTQDRTPLTRDRVIAAAMELADARGLDAVTMRSVAKAVGVQAMSLYNHVENKDDLLAAMLDALASEIPLPSPETSWKPAMRARAIAMYTTFRRHPWGAHLWMSRLNVGPAMMRHVDATIGVLAREGYSYAEVEESWHALDAFVCGFTVQRLQYPVQPSDYPKVAARYLPALEDARLAYLGTITRAIAEGQYPGSNRLEFGLDALLDGLEQKLGGRREHHGVWPSKP